MEIKESMMNNINKQIKYLFDEGYLGIAIFIILLILIVFVSHAKPILNVNVNEFGFVGIFTEKPKNSAMLESQGYQFINYNDFIQGKIFCSAGMKPIVVVGKVEPGIPTTTEAEKCFSLPAYHIDFNKKQLYAFIPNANNLNQWMGLAGKKEYFISNGNPNEIIVPENFDLNNLRAYAPSFELYLVFKNKDKITKEEYLTKAKSQIGKKFAHKGLYLTYYVVRTSAFLNSVLNGVKGTAIDTFVIDFKEIFANYYVQNGRIDMTKIKESEPAKFFKKLVQDLHAKGFHMTARIVTFKDYALPKQRPDLAIRNGPNGGLWKDRSGSPWLDPYSEEVRKYNIDLAQLAAECGFDEVQYDYVRFPTEGNTENCFFPHQKPNEKRNTAIEKMLNETVWRLKPYNVSLAVDIFGVTLWESERDREKLGQRMDSFAEYVDVICPMLYPSHFHAGYDNIPWPADQPYHFINSGCERLKKILKDSGHTEVRVIPWLQGFAFRVHENYGPQYVAAQIKGASDAGAQGYLIWNARNRYEISFPAAK